MRGQQMGMQGAKVDNSKPQSTENFMSCQSREHLLWGAQDGREMESKSNNLVECVVQSDYPKTLDGSSLSLGVGVNTARSKLNASSGDFIGKIDRGMHSQLNPSHEQSGYRSSISHDLTMAAGLSHLQTYAGEFSSMEENAVGLSSLNHNLGGLPSIMQNAGESSNMSAFTGAMMNVDGCSLSDYDLRAANTTSNFSLSPLHMLPMPQSHVPHPFLTSTDPKFGAGYANIDRNQGFHVFSGVSSMVHSSGQSGLPPNQGFHGLSGISPIEPSSSQFALLVQGQLRMTPRPSVSSFMSSNYATLASTQLTSSLHYRTSVSSPVLGNIESINSPYHSAVWQHHPAHQEAAIQSVENAPFSKRVELQLADQLFACDRNVSQVASSFPLSKNFVQEASKDKLSASDRNAAEVISFFPSFNNIEVQAETYLGQSQDNPPVQACNDLFVPTYTSGHVIPVAGESRPATISNLLARPSIKRKAAQTPPATAQVKIKKTRSVKPSIHSATFHKTQNAPFVTPLPLVVTQAATVPPLAQPISSLPPVTVTPLPPLARKGPPPSSLSQATPAYPPQTRTIRVPPSARMSPLPHIKWQDIEPAQLSGENCLLCKRELSYTPAGPVVQPAAPPPVAVLSCGHCFHDICLQRITPKDQAHNPPCIPCVIGES